MIAVLLLAVGIGIGATVLMDAWNFLLKRVFKLPSLNYCLLGRWLRHMPALLYGIGTVAFPFLVMQPSLGLGIASSKTPKPLQARMKSLATHTVYGFGLYVWALVLTLLLPG